MFTESFFDSSYDTLDYPMETYEPDPHFVYATGKTKKKQNASQFVETADDSEAPVAKKAHKPHSSDKLNSLSVNLKKKAIKSYNSKCCNQYCT